MDRFKFRAFIRSQRTLVYLKWFCIEGDGTVSLMTVDGRLMNLRQDDVILEQCTGLKDICGRLIYEGDKVQNPETNKTAVVTWGHKDKNCEYNGVWVCDFGFINEVSMLHVYYKNIEIIGNIHESEAKSE